MLTCTYLIWQSEDAYERLKWESGGHRVQRVPINSPVIQTSAATVAVLADREAPNYGESVPR